MSDDTRRWDEDEQKRRDEDNPQRQMREHQERLAREQPQPFVPQPQPQAVTDDKTYTQPPTLDPRMTHVAMTQAEEEAAAEGGSEGEGGEATAPPVNVDVPHVQQQGNQLTCTMGNWEGEPTSYTYVWHIDDTPLGEDADTFPVTEEDIGKTATCQVTATNAKGSTQAPMSNDVVVESPA